MEPKLTQLLKDFGPSRRSYHPEQPFWRLQNDGEFWEIPEREALVEAISNRPKQGSVPPHILRTCGTRGGFSADTYDALSEDRLAVDKVVRQLLVDNFPASMHEDILDSVGMPWTPDIGRQRRDPSFRDAILRIYEYRCAVCGYDGRLGQTTFGIEAAHIKWHAAGGPDDRDNGVALCTFHHKAIDRGAIGLSDALEILVSQDVNGSPIVTDWLIRLSGAPLRRPQTGEPEPSEEYIAWHRKEVFHHPARKLA